MKKINRETLRRRRIAFALSAITLVSSMPATTIAAYAAEPLPAPDTETIEVITEEELPEESAETTTATETATETVETTTAEIFEAPDLVTETTEAQKQKDPFDEFMNETVSSLWDMGKSKLGENLPDIMDKIFDSIPVVNTLNKTGIGKTLGGLLANVLGIAPEEQPTMKEISDQIKELSEHIDSVKGEIIEHQDNNLAREIEAMENIATVNTYKQGMHDLATTFRDASGKMAETSGLSEQERLVELASLCGSSYDWTQKDKLVGALSTVGSYMSGQENFISNENFYDSLYSLAVKHGAIFSGQAKREVNEYVTNSLETYSAAYAYAMASLNAQETLMNIKNSGEYKEFLNSLPKDMKDTCKAIVTNHGDINAKRKELARLFADVEGNGNTQTVLGQYEKFMDKSDGIFIKREGQFDRETKDITLESVALRCDDRESGSTPSNKIYTNVMASNGIVTNDTEMIDTILDYAKKYDMTIAQVIESAGLEIPENTRYILAGDKISNKVENITHTIGSYVSTADIVYYVEVYDIYSQKIEKVTTPIKSVHEVKHRREDKDPDYYYTINYVNTINFFSFCEKPDNTSAFGSVLDGNHYSLSSGTYTLDEDINISAPVHIPSGANVTVDLNGHTINRGCSKASDIGQAFFVATGANLTIIDSAGNGRVTGAYSKDGTIIVEFGANCSVQGGIFTGNRTDGKGGVFLNYGTVTIENAIVSGNTANDGGAVYNANGAKLNIINSQLNNNKAVNLGGGAVSNHGELNIENSEINGNSAEKSKGGAIFSEGTATIKDSTLNGNTANNGGAVYNQGDCTVRNCTICNNAAKDRGGAFNLAGDSTTMIYDSTVCDNTASKGSLIRYESNDSKYRIDHTNTINGSIY